MTGILIALFISWLLVFLLEKKSIFQAWFTPTTKRLKQFWTGFLIAALLCVLSQFLEVSLKSTVWIVNKDVTRLIFLQSVWYDVKSIFIEELLFRGVLLYLLIKKTNPKTGILVSAITFGIYHWFSYGVLGNAVAMALVFTGTGLMGIAWAMAFHRTKSIMLPLGFHLGWNFIFNTIFSKGPLGDMLLVLENNSKLTGLASLLHFISGLIIVPILIVIYVHYFVPDKANNQ